MKNQITNSWTSIHKNCMVLILSMLTFWMHAQNVGIGTMAPTAKLHIVGSADNSQLMIKAFSTQSNTKPLICLKNSDNEDLMWIHSDDPSNCFLGLNAGKSNTGGFNNLFIGDAAGQLNISGSQNTALGSRSLQNSTTGYNNTSCGYASLYTNSTGSNNEAYGYLALHDNTIGHDNVAIGLISLRDNLDGSENVAVGSGALSTNKGGSGSTAIGDGALLLANNQTSSFQTGNVAVGYRALYGGASAQYNIGMKNTAIGAESLKTNTSGSDNSASGYQALYANTTGYQNSATGSNALKANTSGFNNTGNGFQALNGNTTGEGNTACGNAALWSNSIGDYNTGIGRNAYFTFNNLDNTTSIGYNAGGQVNVSNRIEIGNPSVSWVGGQMNWGTYSDGRIKDNVRADVPGLDFINRLRPVTYNLNIHRQNEMRSKGEDEEWEGKYDIEQMRMTGFIAQEVEQAAHDVDYDFSGVQKPPKESELYSLRYAEFVVPLVKSVQELSQENEALKTSLSNQHETIEMLTQKVESMTKLCQENQHLIQEIKTVRQ